MLTTVLTVACLASLANAYTVDLRPLLNRHYRRGSDRWFRPSNDTIQCFSILSDDFENSPLTLDGGNRFGGDTPCDVRLPPNVMVKFTKLHFASAKSNVRVEAGDTSTVPAAFSRKAFKNDREMHYGPWKLPCPYVYVSMNPQAADEKVEFYFYRPASGIATDPDLCKF